MNRNAKQRQEALRHAMANLIRNTHFAEYVDLLRLERDKAVEEACMDAVIKCPRRHMAAIGAIRTYTEIIQTYEQYLSVGAEETAAAGEV